jgi:hypothetical protein
LPVVLSVPVKALSTCGTTDDALNARYSTIDIAEDRKSGRVAQASNGEFTGFTVSLAVAGLGYSAALPVLGNVNGAVSGVGLGLGWSQQFHRGKQYCHA